MIPLKKVLSQNEIDSLLSALESGEVPLSKEESDLGKANVKNYDFRRPNKLSKDHVNSITNIYENYARMVGNILTSHLRTDIELKIASVEQISFGEFIRSIPNPTTLSIFRLEPLGGHLLMEMSAPICFRMINLLCGGYEEDYDMNVRDFTDIENALLKDILEIVIDINRTAWKDIIEITPFLDKVESNPQLNQTLSFNEAVVLISFKTKINDFNSLINLCIPFRAIEKIIDKLHTVGYMRRESVENENRFKGEISHLLGDTDLSLEVLLGKTSITIEDFMDLQLGDVIQIDKKVDEVLEMYVEENLYFHVQPGLHNKKLSVQIVKEAGEEVSIYEQ